ncbi:hypothetical protein [Pedobacter helvus]|uniref:Uncharacterized protein n=1 Tax=Pedobacter helvus TaxID=2563444 RepID=A0ABW9JLD8_9SPHI|nr:hypothetical protein [Pedobacter ureilyticus]
MNAKLLVFLRWLMVFPVSIGMCILYSFYIHPVLLQGWDKNIVHAFNPLIASVIAIVLAYFIAPKNKFNIALIVAGLFLLAPVTGLIIVMFGIKVNGQEQSILDGGAALATTTLGVIVGIFIAWKFHLRLSSKSREEEIISRINSIEGLEGMTVNERLHAAGLYDEFYLVIKIDKPKARKILTWLKVDEPSIELVIKED